MPRFNYKLFFILGLLALSGCATDKQVISDPEADGYAVQQEVHQTLSDWQNNHDYDATVMRLEKLSRFSGGDFGQARQAALALVQFEHGDTAAFLRTAEHLTSNIGSYEYINPQIQHVLTVAYAMQGKAASELPGRGYDSNRVRMVYRLLGVDVAGVNHG